LASCGHLVGYAGNAQPQKKAESTVPQRDHGIHHGEDGNPVKPTGGGLDFGAGSSQLQPVRGLGIIHGLADGRETWRTHYGAPVLKGNYGKRSTGTAHLDIHFRICAAFSTPEVLFGLW